MRNAFIDELTQVAAKDDRIVLIAVDLGFSVVEKFAEKFPKRFFNVGIQEQNAVSLAAGLALRGKRPFVYSIIPFATMRCFEQIRVDVAYLNTPVRIVGVGAGFGYGPAGATHHAIEDLAVLRSLPNMTVCSPGDPFETRALLKASLTYDHPIYFRLGKGGDAAVHSAEPQVQIGKMIKILEGDKATFFASSTLLPEAFKTAQALKAQGTFVTLYSVPTLKPFDSATVTTAIQTKKPIFTFEEHNIINGLGSAVAELIAESGTGVRFKRFGVPDEYTHKIGSQNYLRDHYGLNSAQLTQKVTDALK